ncbi:MAG: tetratricopeptide repeat protein, partial [Planctomycetota bacterium]|nr:tetratricopeptide repeat protein [Planctomycetota bacterium]
SAVQFAHRNLFIHRDLKPGNILVGADGTANLLDFGISKLLEDDGRSSDDTTHFAMRPLTPRYSSPEHILGDPITTVSDVYCLGIILHEILTGRLPFDTDGTIAGRLWALESETTERPSTLNPRLDREIDSILLKAVARDPEQRYQSVEAMSDDLRRYLSGEPVTAHLANRFYGLRKFMARHRLPVGLAALIVVLAVAFGVVATRQAFRLDQQRQTAVDAQQKEQRAREAAEEINQFLGGILQFGDPMVAKGQDVTLQEALDEAGRRLHGAFSDHPEIQAKLHTTLGKAYHSRGLLVDAERHLRSALETRDAMSQEDDLAVADILDALARVVLQNEQFDEAEALYHRALDIRKNLRGEIHPAVADSLAKLADLEIRAKDPRAAEQLYREAASVLRAHGGDHGLELAKILEALAPLLLARGETEEAAACFSEASQIYRKRGGEDILDGRRLFRRGQALHKSGKHDEARQAYQDAAAIMLRTRKPDDPTLIHLRMEQAVLLRDEGDLEGALAKLEALLPVVERGFPEWHYVRVMCRELCGWILFKLERFAEAEPHLRSTHEGFRKMLGDDHKRTRIARQVLEGLYKRWDRAEPDRVSSNPPRNQGD